MKTTSNIENPQSGDDRLISFTLVGKKALVTGGSRGIGAAIAKTLAAEGAAVAITYEKSKDQADAVVSEIKGLGRIAVAIHADSADIRAIQASVDKAVAELGGLDILVNNAGIIRMNNLADIAIEDIQALLDVNMRGPIITSKAALPHLKEGSSIITIGSYFADRVPYGALGIYAATKSALTGFNQGLARELGPKGITANIVQPGSIDTDMNPADGPFGDPMRQLTASGRFGSGAEIGHAVAYLVSDKARYITGTTLTVDGGANA
ncbi:3-ketoacyl-ACP reductase [Dyadobacter beijingensis]|uniref:3-ketoacyl-ACP reductase n=1 Tax=Dyadobacter beijingensis TaxID=365489 RepID=A0ABQ2ILQ3_9BACT|nr:SDR family oxidoreductase [Dyadobacter beijingensis]GGN13701.1 3-ketoacyl-ACP reductase [Dyadobacter beijingensis]